MRRNNGWLAVLAVSLVLSILRNSLAGERYPLDYENAVELSVNRSRIIYETYNPNELTSPSSRSRSNPPTSGPIAKSTSSSFAAPRSAQSRLHVSDKNVVPSKDHSANPTNVITRLDKLAKLEDEEQSNSGRSILHDDDPRHESRESGAHVVEGSRSFNLGIPRQSRLSSWIHVSRWISRAKSAAKPSKIGGRERSETFEKATRRGDGERSYNGHVDNDSLAIPARRIGDYEREEPPARDVFQTERSSIEESVLKTAPDGSLDLKSVDSSRSSKKIVKKRFLTGYSVFSVSLNRRFNKLERLNKPVVARRWKDRRDGKERRGRSVALYLKGQTVDREGRRDSWPTFDDGDSTKERSTTTRHDDVQETFDSSNVTFHDEESSFEPIEGSDNFTDRSTNSTMSADRTNETILAGTENYSQPNVSETSVLSMYENDSEANGSVIDDIESNRAAVINSRSNANAPSGRDGESALTSTDTSNDLIDGTELDASGEEGAIKERGNAEEEERSALTSVTKEESGSLLAAARRNATYLRRSGMNSLAVAGGFIPDESSALSRHRGRNANDSFRNSPRTGRGGEGGRNVENFDVNSLAERSSVNNEEQAGSRVSPTAPTSVSKNAVLEEEVVVATSSGRDDESLAESNEINDEATPVQDSREPIDQVEATSARRNDRGTLNVSPRIDLEERSSGPTRRPFNRNVGEIKTNESDFFMEYSLGKNGEPSSDSPNVESRKNTMVNLEDRLTNDRDSKERRSRSSKASTPRIEETATSAPNKSLVSIDFATSNGSFQFLSKDPLIPSTTKQPDDLLATSDATLSSTDDDQLETVSTISLISDDDQLLGFDATIVVTSLGPIDDEDLHTTASNVSLRGTDNSSREMEPPDQWPVKHSAVVEGDLVLGGLMMVHEREDTITCGPVMSQGGIQALEAMLYTLDRLNDLEIVPGVKIGAHILDDCDKDTYGLEMAVDFIKGTYTHNRAPPRKERQGEIDVFPMLIHETANTNVTVQK
ncbi:uncharacterized protein LOC122538318 [Frieseomelitta varia]|uniref:uncharacterized protein LOC122538318 n=1 Tax=Frieseomelitta varia TaxID=561572 RepID=UPI001CB68F3E|nr:uncharacterized protein LOC122538318 [Frieseomelitta varia]